MITPTHEIIIRQGMDMIANGTCPCQPAPTSDGYSDVTLYVQHMWHWMTHRCAPSSYSIGGPVNWLRMFEVIP